MDLRLPPRGPDALPPLALLQRWQPNGRPALPRGAVAGPSTALVAPPWPQRLLRWLSGH